MMGIYSAKIPPDLSATAARCAVQSVRDSVCAASYVGVGMHGGTHQGLLAEDPGEVVERVLARNGWDVGPRLQTTRVRGRGRS